MGSSQSYLAVKDSGGRACHHHGVSLTQPFNAQHATRQVHSHFGIKQLAQTTRDYGGAGTSAAGERFTCAALEDADTNLALIDQFHKTGVYTFGKGGVVFHQCSYAGHIV